MVVPEQPGRRHIDSGLLQREGNVRRQPLFRIVRVECQPGDVNPLGEEQLPPLSKERGLAESRGRLEHSYLA